jgi:hypothetical protein
MLIALGTFSRRSQIRQRLETQFSFDCTPKAIAGNPTMGSSVSAATVSRCHVARPPQFERNGADEADSDAAIASRCQGASRKANSEMESEAV